MAGFLNGEEGQTTRGCYYVSSSSATGITAGVPIKVAGTTTAGGCLKYFTHSDNRLTYTGSATIWIHFEAFISMISSINNVTFEFYVAKNGTIISQSKIRRKVGTGADVGAMTVQANVMMSPGDYVEIFADSDLNTNLTVTEMTTAATSIGEE